MSSSQDDKTRIANPGAAANNEAARKAPAPSSPAADERTRLRPPASGAQDETRIRPSGADAPDDRTRIAPAARRPAAPAQTPPLANGADTSTVLRQPSAAGNGTPGSGPSNILKRRFVLEDVLGAGGMGVVYKARDLLKVEAKDRDPYVAIKVLSEEFKSHPEAFIALQRESRKSQRIAHPNIVNVHDFDRDGDTVFMTMEYMDGKPLDKLLKQYQSTGLPSDDAWRILKDICAALIHAHGEDIIHADFKPGNVFVSKRGMAKVFDFGIARAVSKAEAHATASEGDKTLFDAGNLGALTPAYASLEMLQGKAPDPRDDVYALGCVAYELFEGEHPFNKLPADKAFERGKKPRRIQALSRRQWQVIERALAFKREHRVATVEEFLHEITRVRKFPYKTVAASIVLLAGAVAAYVQTRPEPQEAIDTNEIRAEVEEELKLKLRKERIDRLLATGSLSREWETTILSEIEAARQLLPAGDPWLSEVEARIVELYLAKARELRAQGRLAEAKDLLDRAEQFQIQTAAISSEREGIDAEIAGQKAQQQKRLAAEQARLRQANYRKALSASLKEVDKRLVCRNAGGGASDYALDTAKLGKAVARLKEVSVAEFEKRAGQYGATVASCIQNIARDDPAQAEEVKAAARRIFPTSREIAGIKIIPKDPCGAGLAGLGARGVRATCRDPLATGGNGPRLVVVPKGSGHPMFAIAKYETSIAEFNLFCARTKACQPIKAGDSSLPATGVAFALAKRYVSWLNQQTDREYRIPTQREWRYAAKATGGELDPNRNCRLDVRGVTKGNDLVNVRSGDPNPWGLVNHVGNAQEWVLASSGQPMAAGGARTDPMSECTLDTVRGHAGDADAVTGFRVARRVAVR